MKARSPDKFMDVTSDVKVTDEDALLSRRMMIKAKNIMKELIWINAVPSEITLPPLDPDTDTPSCTRSV